MLVPPFVRLLPKRSEKRDFFWRSLRHPDFQSLNVILSDQIPKCLDGAFGRRGRNPNRTVHLSTPSRVLPGLSLNKPAELDFVRFPAHAAPHGATAARDSFCGLRPPELSHFGKSPTQSTLVLVLPPPPLEKFDFDIVGFFALIPSPSLKVRE
jgi:hypothetical protein